MRTIGNILWFVLAGIWLAIGYALAGLVFCITIIGIPLGIQLFKMAQFSLWPFGRHVVRTPGSSHVINTIGNVVWLILFGWARFSVITTGSIALSPATWEAEAAVDQNAGPPCTPPGKRA